jgi:hypothetical protein
MEIIIKSWKNKIRTFVIVMNTVFFFLILVCEAIGTAATPGLLCQPRVIVKMKERKHKIENKAINNIWVITKTLNTNYNRNHTYHLEVVRMMMIIVITKSSNNFDVKKYYTYI